MLIRRGIAYFIDLLLSAVLCLVLYYFSGHNYRSASGEIHYSVPQWVFISTLYGYYIVTDYFWGATLAKKLLGLKVVKIDGSRLTLLDVIKRNLLDLMELVVFLPITCIIVAVTKNNRRIGDFLANTAVIDTRQNTRPNPAPHSRPSAK